MQALQSSLTVITVKLMIHHFIFQYLSISYDRKWNLTTILVFLCERCGSHSFGTVNDDCQVCVPVKEVTSVWEVERVLFYKDIACLAHVHIFSIDRTNCNCIVSHIYGCQIPVSFVVAKFQSHLWLSYSSLICGCQSPDPCMVVKFQSHL